MEHNILFISITRILPFYSHYIFPEMGNHSLTVTVWLFGISKHTVGVTSPGNTQTSLL